MQPEGQRHQRVATGAGVQPEGQCQELTEAGIHRLHGWGVGKRVNNITSDGSKQHEKSRSGMNL